MSTFESINNITDKNMYKLLELLHNTEWEVDAEHSLTELLKVRCNLDNSFLTALLNTKNKDILYCNEILNKYWSCGLKPEVAYLTKLSNIPCHNTIGQILMKLREDNCTN
jgi:predicted NAD-dependent protein-ADP-ribosyltransferase YbiA (DUF1768 family)